MGIIIRIFDTDPIVTMFSLTFFLSAFSRLRPATFHHQGPAERNESPLEESIIHFLSLEGVHGGKKNIPWTGGRRRRLWLELLDLSKGYEQLPSSSSCDNNSLSAPFSNCHPNRRHSTIPRSLNPIVYGTIVLMPANWLHLQLAVRIASASARNQPTLATLGCHGDGKEGDLFFLSSSL